MSKMRVQARELISKRLIGKGSSSIVYETTWKGQSYARKDFLGVSSEIFEEEAKALVGLDDHRNVVRTYCWTVDEESCSLVIELMDDDLLNMMQRRKGPVLKKLNSGSSTSGASQTISHVINLDKFIEDHKKAKSVATSSESVASPLLCPFDVTEALQIIRQIAEGMAFLHGKNLVHGDLKPKNILVQPRGNGCLPSRDQKVAFEVKVADFGLRLSKLNSKNLVSSQERHLEMVRWQAPELLDLSLLLRGNEHGSSTDSESDSDWDSESCNGKTSALFDKAPTKHSDVYSFGLACWQVLTGEDLFSGLDLNELVSTISGSGGLRPELPPIYPVELRDLIQLCLHDEDKRPSFHSILESLEALQASLTRTDSLVDVKKGIAGPRFDQIDDPLESIPEYVTLSGESSRRVGGSTNLLPALETKQEVGSSTSTTISELRRFCNSKFAGSGVRTLLESFGRLTYLKVLDVSCDKNILNSRHGNAVESLPESFGGLTNLEALDMSACKNLHELPESFGELTNLEALDMSDCKNLRVLPESFGALNKLKQLKLTGTGICFLPKSFGGLTNLEALDMSACFSLGVLPESFGELTNLEALDMSDCKNLRVLPESFGALNKLKQLKLTGTGIESLPESPGWQLLFQEQLLIIPF